MRKNYTHYAGKTVLLYDKNSTVTPKIEWVINAYKKWVKEDEGADLLIRDDWKGMPMVIKWDDYNGYPERTPYEETSTETLGTYGFIQNLTSSLWRHGYTVDEAKRKMYMAVGDKGVKTMTAVLNYFQSIKDNPDKEKAVKIVQRFIDNEGRALKANMGNMTYWLNRYSKTDDKEGMKERCMEEIVNVYECFQDIINHYDDMMLDCRIAEKQTA